jgi:hypothetical protein
MALFGRISRSPGRHSLVTPDTLNRLAELENMLPVVWADSEFEPCLQYPMLCI